MNTSITWPELRRSGQLRGQWVALDNCRYDQATLQPIEGNVVDADEDLAALCGRMRDTGRSSCAIVFCGQDVAVAPRESA
ncbi:MAG: hypothetical protein JW751_07620 [Polyangiaceae bacterium]|nr:hypothetical protein [Polyangiaceae bacterium]